MVACTESQSLVMVAAPDGNFVQIFHGDDN